MMLGLTGGAETCSVFLNWSNIGFFLIRNDIFSQCDDALERTLKFQLDSKCRTNFKEEKDFAGTKQITKYVWNC